MDPSRGTAERGDLEIQEDPGYQRLFWKIQRAGWVAMALVVAAALAGMFGGGPLSRASLEDTQASWRLEYERFGRYESVQPLRLDVHPGNSRQTSVWLDRGYLADVRIDHIMPDPVREELSSDGILYVFEWRPGERPGRITLSVTFERIGLVKGRIGRTPSFTQAFSQFVYP